ncbi:hypothetical protein GCM10011374_38710 [Kocuria dechangensis]|uniref:TM2 domain-containing protein n=1 Tax=Kocuria dechangensis TaxID=1176249 RepID=A0A917H8S4_9MICC|nr:TM2 domain-containing protein [Kocuria dechangensis]GGG70427.1 hypothetical protein GCM10011374_38710 [Kocuria dechangensis]
MDSNVAAAQMQYDNEKKSAGVAWLLWLFTGALGGHRFYLGDKGMGIGLLCTLGGLGVWALIDGFFINARLRAANNRKQQEIFVRNGLSAPVAV